jgi:predicted amidophosphoribosyltransferase
MMWRKLIARRYNPAAWLAHALASAANLECDDTLLVRKIPTKNQRGLTRAQRLQNLRRAFKIRDAVSARIKGKAVLLVDDVITTGATANACAKILKAAGASRVDVVTLAHTVLEDL